MNSVEAIRKALEQKGIFEIVGYSRKSREVSEEDMQKHRDIMKDLADRLGYPIKLVDEVESSETLNRTVFNKVREDIQKKKIRCLMIYRIDRVSRKTTDVERLIKEWAFHDLLLIEAHREKVVNYEEQLGIKLETIMSDLYLEQSKQILSAGRKKSVSLYGNNLGEPILGYDYNKESKKLEPNEQAWIVKEIFDLYIKGYSTHSIAQKLNERGLTTRKGQHFKGKGVWDILQNQKYMGSQVFGKKEWYKDGDGKVHCKNRPKEQWIIYEDAHEPIVSKEIFETVKKMMEDSRDVPTGARTRKFPMTQIVICGKCGWSMSAIVRGYKRYNTDMFRSCYRKDYTTGHNCGNKGIKMETVEEFSKKQIWEVVRPAVLKAQRKMAQDRKSLVKDADNSELKELLKQRNQLNKQLDNLIDLQMEMGKSDRLVAKMKQVEEHLKSVTDKIEKLEGTDPTDETLAWVDAYLKASEDLLGFPLNLKGMSNEDQNIFYRRYIKSVTVLEGNITGIQFQPEVERLIGLVT